MAVERLKALDRYLEELKDSAEFPTILEQQCCQLNRELRTLEKLELTDATPLVSQIQQSQRWTSAHKETLLGTIHMKVQATTSQKIYRSRMPMQDYSLFPLYLTSADWQVVQDKHANVVQRSTCLLNRLWALGMRTPSEPTIAMITVVLLLCEPERLNDGLQLRSSYITVKGMVKQFLEGQGSDQALPEVLVKLPPTVGALPDVFSKAAYAEGDQPGPMPAGISIEGLKSLENMVSLRSNNAKLLPLQVPKAASFPMMDQAMTMGASMVAMAMGWTQRALVQPPVIPGHFGFDCL